MRYTKMFFYLLMVFSAFEGLSQSSTSEKIIGCWQFKKIEFKADFEFAEEVRKQLQGSVLCFDSDGKFTNTTGSKINGSGRYSISADGKTITQQTDLSEEDVLDGVIQTDLDAEIDFPDENTVLFSIEFGTVYMERK